MRENASVVETDYDTVTVSGGDDSLIWWMKFAIALLVVVALVGIIYLLSVGILNPTTPRTAIEARLVVLESTVRTNPGSGRAQREYIDTLVASGQVGAAKKQLKLAKESLKGIELSEVLAAEVSMAFSDGDYAGAAKLADAAYKSDLGAREAWVKEMTGKGIKSSVVDMDSQAVVDILVFGARSRGALKDWDKAIEGLSTALTFSPQGADLFVLRAQAYAEHGEKDKARADFEAALKFIPDFQPALDGLKQLKGE
ncbi:MAG: hypothetical protein Q8S43_04675 [Actinomycetota bacterium]|nr:hypothetical protein [Actinomycetota bacterium]MDP3630233.1 hypothetical protein [Actinomycetota bacterium]